MNGLPNLRLLPDAPRPGRSHRTHRARNAQQLQRPVTGTRWHPLPFIPDTNAIEALNRQLRKAIKTKGHFPNEDSARKLIYLAVRNATPQWTRCRNWTTALLAFKIHFGDRLPDTAN
jgi:transposase-like protein